MRRATFLSLALLLGAVVSPGRAGAQPRPAATEEQRKMAEQLFRTGERFFKADKFKDAADSFEQAYMVLPLSAIAFSAAQAYRLQFAADNDPPKLKRAVELYDKYLAEDPKGPRAGDATRNLAVLRPLLIELERKGGVIASMPAPAQATKLMISTTIDVPDARVAIDGGDAHPLPLMAEVTPGRHRIVIDAPGFFRFEESREAVEGDTRPIEVVLVPRPATVSIKTAAGAQVSVDGRPAGATPLVRPLELSPGKHLVTVTRRGHRPFAREITVSRGQKLNLEPPMRRTGQRTLAYAVLGTGAALAIASGVTYTLSLFAANDADDLNDKRNEVGLTGEEFADYRSAVDRRDARLSATYVLVGLTIAVGGTGALLYFMDNPTAEATLSADTAMAARARKPASRIVVTPAANGDSVGLALGARF